MIHRIISLLTFVALALGVVQFINHSFTAAYQAVESSISAQHAAAQDIYIAELANGERLVQ